MSGLKVEALQREFFYNGTRIPDPAPNLSVEQVRELLTPTWPGNCDGNPRRAGGYRQRSALHVQPSHWFEGLTVRRRRMKPEDLIVDFRARAAAPPNRQNELLVRHLRCKESLELSDALTSALVRYHANEVRSLPAPTEILTPLQ
jgi:hypothetical protein